MHHPLACFFPCVDKLDDGRRWIGGKRSKNLINEGWPSEKLNLVFSRESTPTKEEAPQLMQLAIPVKLRATNQFITCTNPSLVFFPRLNKLDDGRRWMGGKRSKNNFWNEGQPSEKPNLILSRESTPTKDEAPQLTRPQSQCISKQPIKLLDDPPLSLVCPTLITCFLHHIDVTRCWHNCSALFPA